LATASPALPRYAEWLMPAAPKVKLALPATVLARHPAVMAAEAELAAAWADIAVARAERLPRLDLGAALSGQWLRAGRQGDAGWSFGPAFSMPLFDGGRGAAAVAAGQARYRLALATLQGAVRDAARDVENALAATQSADTRLVTTREAVDAAQAAFDATDAMWRAGATSLFVLEDARRLLASAQNDAIAAVQDSGQAWIALVLACGNSSITSESTPNETI
jgi:outer membrane protein TolC